MSSNNTTTITVAEEKHADAKGQNPKREQFIHKYQKALNWAPAGGVNGGYTNVGVLLGRYAKDLVPPAEWSDICNVVAFNEVDTPRIRLEAGHWLKRNLAEFMAPIPSRYRRTTALEGFIWSVRCANVHAQWERDRGAEFRKLSEIDHGRGCSQDSPSANQNECQGGQYEHDSTQN